MSNNKSNRGIVDGVLGGLTVSLFNGLSQERDKNKIDWYDFDEFSFSESRKRDGYKLKYDINLSKIKPKIINLIQKKEYLYIIKIENHKIKESIKSTDLKYHWHTREFLFNNMVKDTLYEGIVILEDTLPKYWVYGKKESDDFVQVIIRDDQLGDFNYCDEYPCLDLTEARDLAEEMKKYYHNYVERVLILEESKEALEDEYSNYKEIILDTIPSYFNILEILKGLNILKYDEISKTLDEIKYDQPINIIYTFYSLGMQLYKDDYFNYSKKILGSILKADEELLNETGLKDLTYGYLINNSIELEDEKEIIGLLEYDFSRNYYILDLARELYDLKIYEAAKKAYRIFLGKTDLFRIDMDLFEAYLRTEDDEGMKIWRQELIQEGKDTFLIDRYLSNNHLEGLSIKISSFERNEDWENVIEYSNKYIKLILSNSRYKVDNMHEFDLKKINAYIQLDKLNEAWIGSCKARRTLISNFDGFKYFEYLSKVENHMADISLKQDYFIDSIYHYIFKIIYKDIFYLAPSSNSLAKWNRDIFLEDIIKRANLNEWWLKMEPVIINEYRNLSGKSPRKISKLLLNNLGKNNYKFKLKEPKKYFPKTIATDFNIK